MNFIKNLFLAIVRLFNANGKQQSQHMAVSAADPYSESDVYEKFWQWFASKQEHFYQILDELGYSNGLELQDILERVNFDGNYSILVLGVIGDDDIAELIFTAEGHVEHFQAIEALVAAAPAFPQWRFSALKQEVPVENLSPEWNGHEFNLESLSFYARLNAAYPKNIEIVVCHAGYSEALKEDFFREVHNFLQFYLGENNFVQQVDCLDLTATANVQQSWVKINDLKAFLAAENAQQRLSQNPLMIAPDQFQYGGFEGFSHDHQRMTYFLNTSLLQWDHQCAFPWVIVIEFHYQALTTGMPKDSDLELLDEIEEELWNRLKSSDGYLHLAQETGNKRRLIYLACQDFRKPSKVIADLKQRYLNQFEIKASYNKDKYWTLVDQFL